MILGYSAKLFYTAGAWTGIRTGKLWDNVKGNEKLRKHSLKTLKNLVDRNANGFENLILDDLKVFNKWLAITGALGALASGIEAYRSWQREDELYGRELVFQRLSTASLSVTSAIATLQLGGALTGWLSPNITLVLQLWLL